MQFKPDLACARISISYLEDRVFFAEGASKKGKARRFTYGIDSSLT